MYSVHLNKVSLLKAKFKQTVLDECVLGLMLKSAAAIFLVDPTGRFYLSYRPFV